MSTIFSLPSSDPVLLEKAAQIAAQIVRRYMHDAFEGIVLLGAIPRGYFGRHADIDIALFKMRAAVIPAMDKFSQVDSIEVQIWLSDYESELGSAWDMAKRWTYSQGVICYDPQGKIAQLLQEKVPPWRCGQKCGRWSKPKWR
jgi:hypothetical protein